jgi:hypothetical protein
MMKHIRGFFALEDFVASDAFELTHFFNRRGQRQDNALSVLCMHDGPIVFDSPYFTKFTGGLSARSNRVFVNATRPYICIAVII